MARFDQIKEESKQDYYVQALRVGQLEILTNVCRRLRIGDTDPVRFAEAFALLTEQYESLDRISLPHWVTLLADEPEYIGRPEFITRVRLIDPVLKAHGWIGDLIKREETFKNVVDGTTGRIDYSLRVKVRSSPQLVLVALIEAKHERLRAEDGLAQARRYADGKRENIRFVFSTNGHDFVQFDRLTKTTSTIRPLSAFPTPRSLVRYVPKEPIDLPREPVTLS